MLKRMLLPLDGSIQSDIAIEVALNLAKETGCYVTGMAVLDTPAIESKAAGAALGASYYAAELIETLRTDGVARTEKILEHFDKRCQQVGIDHYAKRRENDPSIAILREAYYHDLVVIPHKTYFKFETQDEPDSCAYQVIKAAPRPVLAVPTQQPDLPYDIALVAWDHSINASHALQAAMWLQLPFKKIVLCTVVGGNVTDSPEAVDAHLARMKEYVHEHGYECETVRETGDPVERLIAQANEHKADVIIAGSCSKSKVHEFFFGSVTKSLVANDEFAVLLYH